MLPQYLLLPMALTTAATHDGPEPSLNGGWSDAAAVGVIHVTLASPFVPMSVRNVAGGAITLV